MKRLPPEAEDPAEAAPTSVRRGGVEVDGRVHALISASFDFAALPRESWSELLGSARALGFRMVDVVVARERHALEGGSFDFGEARPELDLRAFLRSAHSHGLLVAVRPGPFHPGASRSAPHSSLEVGLDVAQEHPLSPGASSRAPAPSTATRERPSSSGADALARATAWLDAVTRVIDSARHPRGPVVAVHLDGEESAVRDDTEALPVDEVVVQRHLAQKPEQRLTEAVLRGAPGLPVSLGEAPSRSRLELRFCDVALRGPPRVRRFAPGAMGPFGEPQGADAPLVDVEIAAGREGGDPLRRVLGALAAGARGFCMLPGCDGSGQPSLLTLEGEPSPVMRALVPLIAAIERLQFHTLVLEPCVQIVISDRLLELARAERLRRTEATGWLSQEAPLGVAETSAPPELRQWRVVRDAVGWLEASLVRHGVPFRYASQSQLDASIADAPWTVVPTTEALGDELAETLSYARRRGLPCTVGPFVPTGRFESASAANWPLALGTTETAVAAQVRALLADGQLPQREVSPDVARTLCHVRVEAGRATPAALFVLNPSRQAVEVSVACPGVLARDALTRAQIPSFAERLLIPVAAQGIRMLELFPADAHGDERY